MKKKFLYLLLISVTLFSCNSKKAVDFNNAVVNKMSELRMATDAFNAKVLAVSDNNYNTLEPDRQTLVNLMDKTIKEVGDMRSGMSGGDDFKNSFTDYYKFERDMCESEFKDLCKLTGSMEDGEKKNAILMRIQDRLPRETTLKNNVLTQQKSFASKNNFKLQ